MAEPSELEAIFAEPIATPTPEPVAPSPASEAPKVDATPPAPQTPVVEQPKVPEGYVPIAAMLDERDKRKRSDERFAALEAKHKEPQQQPTLQSPEEIAAYVRSETARAEWNAKASTSEIIAREKHGDETVNTSIDWAIKRCENEIARLGYSPFRDEQMRHVNPVDWIVRQHKKDTLVSELGDDDASQKAYIERRARELGLIPPASPIPQSASAPAAPQPTPSPAPQPLPTRSLAAATSAGGPQTPVLKTEQEVFKEAFS